MRFAVDQRVGYFLCVFLASEANRLAVILAPLMLDSTTARRVASDPVFEIGRDGPAGFYYPSKLLAHVLFPVVKANGRQITMTLAKNPEAR